MRNIVLIFAGGVGNRMYGDEPKQFLEVSGKPIIVQTIELFEQNEQVDEIYIACVKKYIPRLEEAVRRFSVTKIRRIFPGGRTGMDSIYRGLSEIAEDHEDATVLIHDGVRPLVDQKTISNCIADVEKFGSAVTVTPAFETPIISEDGKEVGQMVVRDKMYTVQAPQCFRLREILKFHEKERTGKAPYEGIVDSCGLAFKHGLKAHMTEGNRGNVKVTTLEDYLTLISNSAVENYRQLFRLAENRKRFLSGASVSGGRGALGGVSAPGGRGSLGGASGGKK